MKLLVLYNPRSGGGTGDGNAVRDRLAAAFDTAGADAHLVAIDDGIDLSKVIREAAGSGFVGIVAAGGDGTVSSVASHLVGTEMPLGVLPCGTLNHFSKDLGLPPNLEAAARVIAAGSVRQVDMGEVSGRFFLNNSSIGLYPHLVRKRDRNQERLGFGKWPSMVMAILTVFRRYPVMKVRIDTGGEILERKTPFVFVGNNFYPVQLFSLGKRDQLDRRELCLYIAHHTSRFGLLILVIRALIGRLNQSRDFESLCLKNFSVQTKKRTLRVALDGEVTRLKPPLEYRVRPMALRVFTLRGSPID